MTDTLARYAKAVAAFITPAVYALIVATQRRTPGGTDVTTNEWLVALGASLGIGAAVAVVPNKKKREDRAPKRRPRNPRPNQREG